MVSSAVTGSSHSPIVNDGTLRVDGSIASSSGTTVNPGGTNPGNMDNFLDAGNYSWEFVRTTGGIVGPLEASDFVFDTFGVVNPFTGIFGIDSDGEASLFLTYTPAAPPAAPSFPSRRPPRCWGLMLVGLAACVRRR